MVALHINNAMSYKLCFNYMVRSFVQKF